MKNKWYLALLLLLVFVLGACQGKTTSTEPVQATDIVTQPQGQAYPDPQNPTQISNPAASYPALKDGEEASWFQAIAMLTNGEASRIDQTDETHIALFLKDGRQLIVIVASADQVQSFLAECGDVCKGVVFNRP